MISERIRELREQAGLSQSQLAKRLDVTRSSVNAWEMGLSAPTTQYIVSLTKLFHVSADYILGTESDLSISMRGYTEKEITLVLNLLNYFDEQH
ncbi:MAG: helix-turn-helix transcriptional regulator [Lachnospiraceae bacterium]|nr:helix-turn-helix transcriptional regulator [Lachnospiraceae bacterium]